MMTKTDPSRYAVPRLITSLVLKQVTELEEEEKLKPPKDPYYIGVEKFNKKSWASQWIARVTHDGKAVRLGIFETRYEAACARDRYLVLNNLVTKRRKLNFVDSAELVVR